MEAADDGLFGILWETVLLDDIMMQLVAQELCTGMSAVSIVDAEKAALGPLLVLSVTRLGDVENDGDAVLIVRSY